MRLLPRILIAFALALTLPMPTVQGGDKPKKERVKGKAYGNPSKPPVTNRPPARSSTTSGARCAALAARIVAFFLAVKPKV